MMHRNRMCHREIKSAYEQGEKNGLNLRSSPELLEVKRKRTQKTEIVAVVCGWRIVLYCINFISQYCWVLDCVISGTNLFYGHKRTKSTKACHSLIKHFFLTIAVVLVEENTPWLARKIMNSAASHHTMLSLILFLQLHSPKSPIVLNIFTRILLSEGTVTFLRTFWPSQHTVKL